MRLRGPHFSFTLSTEYGGATAYACDEMKLVLESLLVSSKCAPARTTQINPLPPETPRAVLVE